MRLSSEEIGIFLGLLGLGGAGALFVLPHPWSDLIGWSLIVIAGGGLFWLACIHFRSEIDSARKRLQETDKRNVAIAVLIIGAAALVVAVVVLGLRKPKTEFIPKTVLVHVPTSQGDAANIPILTLRPNIPPSPPKEQSKQIARYLQLKDKLAELADIKKQLQIQRDYHARLINPKLRNGSIAEHMALMGWQQLKDNIRKINDLIYQNRPINLDSLEDEGLLSVPAPNESEMEGIPALVVQYRRFYYVNDNILKQIDALSNDMKQELERIEIKIEDTPAWKAINK